MSIESLQTQCDRDRAVQKTIKGPAHPLGDTRLRPGVARAQRARRAPAPKCPRQTGEQDALAQPYQASHTQTRAWRTHEQREQTICRFSALERSPRQRLPRFAVVAKRDLKKRNTLRETGFPIPGAS
jgi:hypothetical protein